MFVENKEMMAFVAAVKNTEFYKNCIKTLFTCEETPDILWAEFKAPYTKKDEIAFWQETDAFEFILSDAAFAFEETENGVHMYTLKEVA